MEVEGKLPTREKRKTEAKLKHRKENSELAVQQIKKIAESSVAQFCKVLEDSTVAEQSCGRLVEQSCIK